MNPTAPPFNPTEVKFNRLPDLELFYYPSLGSTNQEARNLVESASKESYIVVTDQQTDGKGRRGRQWESRSYEDLTFSICFPQALQIEESYQLALFAIHGLLLAMPDLSLQFKWPNDVWLGGKKCGGILVETWSERVIVGIGLNVYGDLKAPDRCTLADSPVELPSREEILSKIVSRFFHDLEHASLERVIQNLEPRLGLLGQPVSYVAEGRTQEGLVEGLGDKGGLLIKDKGELLDISEVRLLHRES